MRTVNMHAAKTHLSSLVEEVQKGAEIIIAKAGKPVARLVPIEPATGLRPLGLLRGKIWEAPDAWDPDPDLERLFYEGDPSFPSALDEVATGDAPAKADG
jgi:prevent-host-death family protein